ncbi:MAG: hypothetical protein H0U55_07715 [Rubrobacteraceae bacterium]|nr:hypothetical protein [Rubrobacteraceae bacterium]
MDNYPNYNVLAINAPASGGAETVTQVDCDFIAYAKNDGVVDVQIAFDQPNARATVATKPFTIKASESISNIPIRTGYIALKSTGAVSAVRILCLF